MALSQDLLAILACPRCKREVRLLTDETGLVCDTCRLKYPITEGVPVMLVDEAEKVGG